MQSLAYSWTQTKCFQSIRHTLQKPMPRNTWTSFLPISSALVSTSYGPYHRYVIIDYIIYFYFSLYFYFKRDPHSIRCVPLAWTKRLFSLVKVVLEKLFATTDCFNTFAIQQVQSKLLNQLQSMINWLQLLHCLLLLETPRYFKIWPHMTLIENDIFD